jgi:hypothetical protein
MTARFAALLLLSTVACAPEKPVALTAGEHRFEAVLPTGWQLLNQGSQTVLRNGESEIVFVDAGAVHPPAFRAEVERAWALWSGGGEDEARTRLERVRIPKGLFQTPEDYRRFIDAWNPLVSCDRGTPLPEVEALVRRLLAAIGEIEPARLEQVAEVVLEDAGHDARRYEMKSLLPLAIDGREGMRIETWMTLTHADLRRWIVVVNGGRALVVRHNRTDSDALAAFDAVASSVHFPAPESR